MKRIFVFIVALLALVQLQAHAQTDSVQRYVSAALEIMKNRSVNRHRINWDSLCTDTYKRAAGLKTIKETYPVLKHALTALNDAHSNFYPPEQVEAYTLGYRATGQEFPVIKAKITDNNLAHIELPPIGCYHFAEWDELVNTFYEKITELQSHKPKGWILDLRGNYGGMWYPMLAAISPMLDQHQVIGTVDADGQYAFFDYRNGQLFEGGKAAHRFHVKKQPRPVTQPLVILVSKKTASSGEFCTIAFAGQKQVTVIGQTTQGLTSGNQEYKLADGAFLVLTTGNTVDRHKKEYNVVGQGVTPQVLLNDLSDEACLKAANDILSRHR
ncbi:S41 family peptidase [Taibaiella chishuiensis]|uniref:Peptidase S41-like protein n=1 Tax=Taibaiella chishuiensis TaxID=1434707 RepID=A0A2P8D4F2_9BACT|nr:S41 family peptidase [Taibaiella chishuiensis]PSK92090.1 peptidase S41-like protein [Taibaiella chishuiensis]